MRYKSLILAALMLAVVTSIAWKPISTGRCHFAEGRIGGKAADGWIAHKDSIHTDSNWTYDTCNTNAMLGEVYNAYKFRCWIDDTTTSFSLRLQNDSAEVIVHLQTSYDGINWNHVGTETLDSCNVVEERLFYDRPAGNNANDTIIGGLWRTIAHIKTIDIDATATPVWDSVKIETRLTATIK